MGLFMEYREYFVTAAAIPLLPMAWCLLDRKSACARFWMVIFYTLEIVIMSYCFYCMYMKPCRYIVRLNKWWSYRRCSNDKIEAISLLVVWNCMNLAILINNLWHCC